MSEISYIVGPATDNTTAAARARGNLAAIVLDRHGIRRPYDPATLPAAVKAELRDLAQALGVDNAPQRRPGHCACGAVLTVTASGQQIGEYLRGHCSACSHALRRKGTS